MYWWWGLQAGYVWVSSVKVFLSSPQGFSKQTPKTARLLVCILCILFNVWKAHLSSSNVPRVCLRVHKSGTVNRRLSSQTFEPLTFLCQRSIGFIFVHQQLDLLWFERRVEYLVQARVSLFTVNELRHLLRREVWTTLSPPEERGEETTSRGGGVTKRDVGTRAEFKSENMRKWKLKGEMLKGRRRRRRSGN